VLVAIESPIKCRWAMRLAIKGKSIELSLANSTAIMRRHALGVRGNFDARVPLGSRVCRSPACMAKVRTNSLVIAFVGVHLPRGLLLDAAFPEFRILALTHQSQPSNKAPVFRLRQYGAAMAKLRLLGSKLRICDHTAPPFCAGTCQPIQIQQRLCPL